MFSDVQNRREFLQRTFLAGSLSVVSPGWSQESFEARPWNGPASDFKLVDILGKIWTPSDWAGRAVLINFWASWCGPCRAEMPSLQEVAAFYGDSTLLVLFVNLKESPQRVMRFAQGASLQQPLLLDKDGHTARLWGVKVLPTTLTLDRHGRTRHRIEGEVDWTSQNAEKIIASLLR